MKVTIEKVPEGVRLTLIPDGWTKKPITLLIYPAQTSMIQQLIHTAMNAAAFKVDVQL